MSFAVHPPFALKVALVSEELDGVNDCLNKSAVTASWVNKTCHVTKASCLLFDQINNYTIDRIHFATFDEAYESLKRGKVLALVHVHKSFSAKCNELLVHRRSIFKASSEFGVDVYSDRTNFILSLTIDKKLNEMVSPFLKSLFSTCNYSTNFLNTPTLINFQAPIFGAFDWNYKHYITPILLVM